MKITASISLFLLAGLSLSGCASITRVADDDVYVMKNPSLPDSETASDESSYQTFRYKRDHNIGRAMYGCYIANNFQYNSLLYYNPHNPFSPYYNPYFEPGAVSFYYTPYGYGTYGYYSNMWNYGQNNYYGYNYSGCNGYYGSNNYGLNYQASNPLSYNTHQGPRNSISGNYVSHRLGNVSGKKAIYQRTGAHSTQLVSSSASSDASGRRLTASSGGTTNASSSARISRPVQQGTAMSRSGSNVSSNSTHVRRTSFETSASGRTTEFGNSGGSGRSSSGSSVEHSGSRNSGGGSVQSGGGSRSGGGSSGGATSVGKRPL